VGFKPDREIGTNILRIENLGFAEILQNFSLTVHKGDKIAFVGAEHQAKSVLFDILAGEKEPDSGEFAWGQTITFSYFPKENAGYFNSGLSITDWLKQYSPDQDETYVRSFLGRMLFSGDEALKPVNVLSGGEKVRCMLARMMLSGANVLILDEPTNHLDLEAITALNDGLTAFKGVTLFNSQDHQFVNSIANRIVEILPSGVLDRTMLFDDYLADESVKTFRAEAYQDAARRI
jgi:ATPase subunit of ABC transporter with duplicated ATPase domains